ncbi:histidine kinase [Porticoccus sp. W117]|uniref:sensor histidine kinase n=1 Tax=Porticoccus sp. W117 TaxID=3054777 RepID=UPI0025914118|nr:histidine kinase [Porticoccus sp. W117]MDM3870939.1 histidine kinase [Porticoccus sp. W117]
MDLDEFEGHLPTPVPDSLLPNLCRGGEGLLSVIVITELLAILIVIAGSGVAGFDWSQLGKVSMLALWISLLSAVVLCKTRRLFARWGLRMAAIASLVAIVLVALVCSALLMWLTKLLGIGSGFDSLQLLDIAVVTVIPAGILLRYLYLQQQLRLQQKAELESRIQALQSRIRPHFLFNSMNMIASLIGSDPAKAERVVEDLSDLFRCALSEFHTLVPLRDELTLCRRYLALEGLRLGDRLKVEWQIGDYGEEVRIPSLALQPVLENAIYHGIQLLPDGGTIKISLQREGNRLTFEVNNPRSPIMESHRGSRTALTNIRHRLEAHFGSSATVTAEEGDNCYITRISYPVIDSIAEV